MAEIDQWLGNMTTRQAERMVITNDQPARLYRSGVEVIGPTIAGAHLRRVIEEIVPAELRLQLSTDGQFQFARSLPNGTFSIVVERTGIFLRVTIFAPAPVEAPPAIANPFVNAPPVQMNAAIFPPPLQATPPPLPPPDGTRYSSPASTAQLEAVGCLPALGVMVLCLVGLVGAAAVLGDWASYVIWLGSSIWVVVDANSIGVKRGQIRGMGDMTPWGWFFGCLLLWIVVFPCYIVARPLLQKANGVR